MADDGGLKKILTAMVRHGPPSSVVISEASHRVISGSHTGADCYGGRTADNGGRPSAIDLGKPSQCAASPQRVRVHP